VNEIIKNNLEERSIVLSASVAPKYEYVTSTSAGALMFFSGKTAQINGVIVNPGLLGDELSIEQGREAAIVCATNLLSQMESDIGLENIEQILKLAGFVASTPNFFDQPTVINAASELFVAILGDAGKHARSAIGVAALPGNSAVEIELIIKSK